MPRWGSWAGLFVTEGLWGPSINLIKTVQLAVFHTCLVFGSKVMTCKIIVEAE